ncbi:DNA-binding NarL/FixJ family response regulator [Pararhizobium capsulatum DSM 1112]|uniref:DNA-binding NarL/FixJ family response regulator n=1 Tax=Pararhizobium capsulatum DSM 1112 TaxID=1121113 RepID=A0ABU0BVA3_9HYPH|nr:response regulator transcription factor [Pararhizobium capsulatum]MDQ0322182.1 DNA-binding NarL/FixJ family response regulator [Pararhizobium capsulatum DSM 1112]
MNSVSITSSDDIAKIFLHPDTIATDDKREIKHPDSMALAGERSLVIIDGRALDRECLAKCIASHKLDMCVLAFGSVGQWQNSNQNYPPLAAILLNIGGRNINDQNVADEIRYIADEFEAPVIVLADSDDLGQIMRALEYGAKGYIPSSVNIEVCIEAIALSLAGGIFVPASSVLAMRQRLDTGDPVARPSLSGMFTARQAEVVEALRRGKANKIIAYELNLRESTVKVHIRNIMKKVKATNRTEVAYKINDLFPVDSASDRAKKYEH